MKTLNSFITNPRLSMQRLFLHSIHRWRNLGLTKKMVLLVTVGLTGLLTIFGTLGVWTSRQALQQTLNDRLWLARQSASMVDSQLVHLFELMEIAAGQVDLEKILTNPEDWDRLQSQFSQLTCKDLARVNTDEYPLHLINSQGKEINGSQTQLLIDTENKIYLDWENIPAIQAALNGNARNISVLKEPQLLIILAVPLPGKEGNGTSGCLAATLNPQNLVNLSSSVALNTSSVTEQQQAPIYDALFEETLGFLEVIDGHGTVLFSTSSEFPHSVSWMIPDSLLKQLFSEGRPGVETCLGCEEPAFSFPGRGDLLGMRGNEELGDTSAQVIAFAPLTQAPWGVVIRQRTDVLFAPVRRLAVASLALGAIAIMGALILVRVTTSSVILPVQQLTQLSQRIADSSFSSTGDLLEELKCFPDCSAFVVADQRGDEIGALARSFSQMCQRLRQSLQENQEWLHQLDVRVQARTKELSILNSITQTVNQSLDLRFILEKSLEEILRLTGVDVGAIYLQEEGGGLQLMAHRGLSEPAARLAAQVGMLDGDCGGVVQHGQVVVVPDLSRYRGRRARSLKAEQMASLIHVPLIAHGAPLGSMCIGTRHLHQFEGNEQNLLVAIGSQIAVAVENARLYQEVQQKEQLLSELLRKALAAQEDERKRIARELHDEVSQAITALMFAAEAGLGMNPPASLAQQLQNIYTLAQRTLDNIHQLIFDLRPSILDHLGLIPAIRWLTNSRLEENGIRVALLTGESASPSLEQLRLPGEIEVALYRIIQEAVTNILRHSGARNVTIQFHLQNSPSATAEEPRGLYLSIHDDGIGFDLNELEIVSSVSQSAENSSYYSHRGWGILGMRERIELLGGEFHLNSAPGEGTTIDIYLPLLNTIAPAPGVNTEASLEPEVIRKTQQGKGNGKEVACDNGASAVISYTEATSPRTNSRGQMSGRKQNRTS